MPYSIAPLPFELRGKRAYVNFLLKRAKPFYLELIGGWANSKYRPTVVLLSDPSFVMRSNKRTRTHGRTGRHVGSQELINLRSLALKQDGDFPRGNEGDSTEKDSN